MARPQGHPTVNPFTLSMEEPAMTAFPDPICISIRDHLATAFTWHNTPQGEKYWAEVSDNLHLLSYGRKDVAPPSPRNTAAIGPDDLTYSTEVDEEIYALGEGLLDGFTWDMTPQGFPYWWEAYSNLSRLSRGVQTIAPPPCPVDDKPEIDDDKPEPEAVEPETDDGPLLIITRDDFVDGEYVGRDDIYPWCGPIDIDGDLGDVHFGRRVEGISARGALTVGEGTNIHVKGCVAATGDIVSGGHVHSDGSVRAEGDIDVHGNLIAGCGVVAGGSVRAAGVIAAKWRIVAARSILAGSFVTAGEDVEAGLGIKTGAGLQSGTTIKAGTTIQARNIVSVKGISAGSDIITDGSISTNGAITTGGRVQAAGGIRAARKVITG